MLAARSRRDTHRLDLMEHYGWSAHESTEGGWFVDGRAHGDSHRIFQVHAPTLREALDDALAAQFRWSTGEDVSDAKSK